MTFVWRVKFEHVETDVEFYLFVINIAGKQLKLYVNGIPKWD